MAFKPMSQGIGQTETVLWTNSAPTSSFASQAITLSDSILNYDYISIEFRASTTADDHYKLYFKWSDLSNYTSSVGRPILGMLHTNNYYYYRMLQYDSYTQLTFGNCVRNTATGTAGTNNVGVIPLTIKGVIISNHIETRKEYSLWVNTSPTSAFASQTITLSDNISNYDYIVIETRFSTSEDTRTKYIYKTSEFSNCTTGSLYPMPYLGDYYSNYYYYRLYAYASDNQITFGTCKRNTASGSASNYNSACIPVSIKGIKFTSDRGSIFDFMNPNVSQQTDIASNETLSIPVTQTPRYVVLTYTRASNSADRSGIEIYDVKADHRKSWRYTSEGYKIFIDDLYNTDVNTVSDSTVTLYNSHAWTARFEILIYY